MGVFAQLEECVTVLSKCHVRRIHGARIGASGRGRLMFLLGIMVTIAMPGVQ
jgi:hypothetical protein